MKHLHALRWAAVVAAIGLGLEACISSKDWTGTNGSFTLIPNHPPTAPTLTAATLQNQVLSLAGAKLLATATDPDYKWPSNLCPIERS